MLQSLPSSTQIPLPRELVIAKRAAPAVSPALKQEAKESLREWVVKAREVYQQEFPMPTISFDLRGTTAGYAYHRKNHVQLNPVLLAANLQGFKDRTIPHELAHLLAHRMAGIKTIEPHGAEWQGVMRKLGLKPERTHSYDVSEARVVARVAGYSCGCQTYELSVRQHNKILRGAIYACRKCNQKLKKDGASPPATTPTTPVVSEVSANPPTPKMLAYATVLAAKAGTQLPALARTSYRACQGFIEQMKMQSNSAPAANDAPTERQLSYARSIALRKKLTLPESVLANRQQMSEWISANQ